MKSKIPLTIQQSIQFFNKKKSASTSAFRRIKPTQQKKNKIKSFSRKHIQKTRTNRREVTIKSSGGKLKCKPPSLDGILKNQSSSLLLLYHFTSHFAQL